MRTRDRGYEDYGIRDGEERQLMELARSTCHRKALRDAAYQANTGIAEDIIYSVVNGLSYDRLSQIRDIPAKKDDFYAYRRKALAIFRDILAAGQLL